MSLGDPLISDADLDNIRMLLSNGFGLRQSQREALFSELDRLREHNAYLTQIFYGICSLSTCERHNAIPIVERVRERLLAPSCRDCLAEENQRLREQLGKDDTAARPAGRQGGGA